MRDYRSYRRSRARRGIFKQKMRLHPHGCGIGKGDVRSSVSRGKTGTGRLSREKSEILSPVPEKTRAVKGDGHDNESATQQSTAPYPVRPFHRLHSAPVEVWSCMMNIPVLQNRLLIFVSVYPNDGNIVSSCCPQLNSAENSSYFMPHLLDSAA